MTVSRTAVFRRTVSCRAVSRQISLEGFKRTFWERHSNPKSGWSRVIVTPVLLFALYHRKPRLAAAAIVFTAINPLLFSPPETDEAWMTRVVLAERWWTEERNQRVVGLTYPNVLNLINIPTTGYAFIAAYRREPVHALIAGLASILLKFWYVGALTRRYDAETSSRA